MALPLVKALATKNKMMYDSAIRLNTKLYGIQTDIYYPKEVGHYSGRHDDIQYNPEPDLTLDLLIPGIYSKGYKTNADIKDNQDKDELTCYIPSKYEIPQLTRLTCISPQLGTFHYLVKDPLAYRLQTADIYKEYIIVPYLNYDRDKLEESDNIELRLDYFDEKAALDYTDDRSIAGPNGTPNPEIPEVVTGTPKGEIGNKEEIKSIKFRPAKVKK